MSRTARSFANILTGFSVTRQKGVLSVNHGELAEELVALDRKVLERQRTGVERVVGGGGLT